MCSQCAPAGSWPGFGRPRDSMFSASALTRWLRATTALRRLEDGVLPLTVVATDLETGEEVLLDKRAGRPCSRWPRPPCRASFLQYASATAGWWTAVWPRTRPSGPAVRAGADRVWVLPSVPSVPMAPPPDGAWTSCSGPISITLARHTASIVATWAGRCELYVVPAPLVPGVSPFNFDKSRQLIDAAYRLTVAGWKRPGPSSRARAAHALTVRPGGIPFEASRRRSGRSCNFWVLGLCPQQSS